MAGIGPGRDTLPKAGESSGRRAREGAPRWPLWSARHDEPDVGGAPESWPVYEPGSGGADGIDDRPRRRLERRRVPIAWVTGVVSLLAAAAAGVVVSQRPQAPAPVQAARIPPIAAGEQWTPVDASLKRGLVRVQVTASVEADGIVMTDDGLVATSYARLVALNGSVAAIDAVELNVIADGGMPMRADIAGFDASLDVAVLRVAGYTPSSVAAVGGPVRAGERLTVLDDQGASQPVVGFPVTVKSVRQPCSRVGAAMIGRPEGFVFSLGLPTAEPGGALVRSDGTVVGMYYGGDDGPRCAVPIAKVAGVVRNVERGRQTATTRVGPPGGLGIGVTDLGGEYPEVTSIDVVGGLAEAAGVKVGDLLTRVDGTSLRSADLSRVGPEGLIRSLEPGRKVTIEWRSGGAPRRASVVVGVGATPHG